MAGVPRLVDLCMAAIADEVIQGDDNSDILMVIYELPSEFFESLLPRLPPLALQKLQETLLLRLPNALCVAETCDLLQSSKLGSLKLQWIKSNDHGFLMGICLSNQIKAESTFCTGPSNQINSEEILFSYSHLLHQPSFMSELDIQTPTTFGIC